MSSVEQSVRGLLVDPAGVRSEASRGIGLAVLGTLGFLQTVGNDAPAAIVLLDTLVPFLLWFTAAVTADALVALFDDRNYFVLRIDGWYPLAYRALFPPIIYFAYLTDGGDEPFRRFLVLSTWASAPLLVPAVIDAALAAAGVTTPVAVWAVGAAWSGLLWARALAAARDVRLREAGAVVATVLGGGVAGLVVLF